MRSIYVNSFVVLVLILELFACRQPAEQTPFKIIGYLQSSHVDTARINFDLLTHINYSFAIPAADSGHVILEDTESLKRLVKKAHQKGVKIFLSIGGWWIGDEPGDDARFHRMAESPGYRTTFTNESMALVTHYHLDGIDLDWEYPDPDSKSFQNYVLLVHQLSDSLHARGLQLSAAVVSHGHQGDGVSKEIFEAVDWLNLMAYDNDDGKWIPHSPFSLAEETIQYWIEERRLPTTKAILGLPFYGKPWNRITDYKDLIKAGADPNSDQFDSVFYNGIVTIKQKTNLAMSNNLGGVMIWEISQDTVGNFSLLKAIQSCRAAK